VGGKFEIVRELGRGGMGCVFEAVNVTEIVPGRPLGKKVAIKVLLPKYSYDDEIADRFGREAQAAARLGGESIVEVSDAGRTPAGGLYFVMEFLEGKDCYRLLTEHPRGLPIGEAVEIVVQVCRGLRQAHEEGLVHRDLKPANLFLVSRIDGARLVKILDFGIAKHRPQEGDQQTRAESFIGTPAYASPEQIRDASKVDARSDVYALGVILYELLSGRRPFEAESDSELGHRILYAAPAPLSVAKPGLPKLLCDLVHRTISRDREERPQSVRALELELAPFAVSSPARVASRGATETPEKTKVGREALENAPTAAAPRAEVTTNAPVMPALGFSTPRERGSTWLARSWGWVLAAALLIVVIAGLRSIGGSAASRSAPSSDKIAADSERGFAADECRHFAWRSTCLSESPANQAG
jgi:serine/threonine-protein kinase